MRTMMGMRVATTGSGVSTPSTSLDSATLKTGSRVFTVCVRLMATAAKDRFAAMWPTACIAAGAKIVPNSPLVIGCARHAPPSAPCQCGHAAPLCAVCVSTLASHAASPFPAHRHLLLKKESGDEEAKLCAGQPGRSCKGMQEGMHVADRRCTLPKEAFFAPTR